MGKRRAAWLLLLAAGLGLYLFDNGGGTRLLLAAVLLLPLCSGAALLLSPPRVTAELALPEGGRRGQALIGKLTLKNGGRLPLPLTECLVAVENRFTGERLSLTWAGGLRAGETVTAELDLTAAHCGMLAAEVSCLRVMDPLGLFARRIPCPAGDSCLVPPEVHPVEVALAEAADFLVDSESYSASRPGYDPSETFQIRPYAPGDPLRQVHWKLSEKTGELMVRDFGLPVVNDALLLLEPEGTDGDGLDTLLDLLSSVSRALLARGTAHTVGWPAEGEYRSWEVLTPEDLDALWALLLAKRAGGGRPVTECYEDAAGPAVYAHVAVLASRLPAGCGALCRGNRVTALLPEGGGLDRWTEGVEVIPFSRALLDQGELTLEL